MERFLTRTLPPGQRQEQQLKLLSSPQKKVPSQGTSSHTLMRPLLPSSGSSSSSSSSSVSGSSVCPSAGCLESSITTSTVISKTASISSSNTRTTTTSSSSTATAATAKVAPKTKIKEDAEAEYRRFSSMPLLSDAFDEESALDYYDHVSAPALPIAASKSKSRAKTKAGPDPNTKKKKKKANVQDNPAYREATKSITEKTTKKTTTVTTAIEKTKTPTKKRKLGSRRNLFIEDEAEEDTEADAREGSSSVAAATKAPSKIVAVPDDIEDSAEADAGVDDAVALAEATADNSRQDHAIERFERETTDSMASLEDMRTTAIMWQSHMKRWQKFAVDELAALRAKSDEAVASVKTVARIQDMVSAFSKLCPVSGRDPDTQHALRTSVIKTMAQTRLISMDSDHYVHTKNRPQRCHVLSYLHPTADGMVKVCAWVNDRDTRQSTITVQTVNDAVCRPVWSGHLAEHPTDADEDYEKLDGTACWETAFSGPHSTRANMGVICDEWEFAARLFILSHQLGKPFS